jgi:5'-nucleotidase
VSAEENATILDILVTNDDGIEAPGIRALAEQLREVGNVTVVAPAREMSAVSHALTIHEPLRFEHVGERRFKVEGTPADCVNLAVMKLLPKPPDIVVSGINRGANVGDDIAYSGTVAGAREAAMLGVPSMAVSLASKEGGADYSHAAAFAAQILPVLAGKKDWSRRTFLNVNVPHSKVKGVRITSQGRRESWTKVEERVDPASRIYYWVKQGFTKVERESLSDISALRDSYISITPLQFDFTAYSALEELQSWGLRFNGSP